MRRSFSNASASQLALFLVFAPGATTPANSRIRAPAAGFSSVLPHQVAPISSATDPSPSHPTWSAVRSLSSQPLKSKHPQAALPQNSAGSSSTSELLVASPASSDQPLKHCELQQSPSRVSEDLQRFFRKLVEWFPEPTPDEMKCVGLRGERRPSPDRR